MLGECYRAPGSGEGTLRFKHGCVVLLLISAWACGGGTTAPSPSSPTPPPTTTVSSVIVSGTAPAIGATAQFIATVTLSNSTSQNVTALATWQSSNVSVVAVSNSGIVTGVSAGEADVRATYLGVSGTQHVTIAPTPLATPAAWLDLHNAVRAGTFAGVTLNPPPSPALPVLIWSTSAEAVAQAWANGCVFEHNVGRSADGVQRGENIAAYAGEATAAAGPVGRWAGEWVDYTYASNTCGAGRVCGHYTQLVWRTTTKIGCASAVCRVNSPFSFSPWTLFVCDYEPPGNVVGRRPY